MRTGGRGPRPVAGTTSTARASGARISSGPPPVGVSGVCGNHHRPGWAGPRLHNALQAALTCIPISTGSTSAIGRGRPYALGIDRRLAMRLPRMTTRRWMIAVAIVGMLTGGAVGVFRLKERHDQSLAYARQHDHLECLYKVQSRLVQDSSQISDRILELVEDPRQVALGSRWEFLHLRPLVDGDRQTVASLPRKVAYHAAMAQKYRNAARYPWLPIEPESSLTASVGSMEANLIHNRCDDTENRAAMRDGGCSQSRSGGNP